MQFSKLTEILGEIEAGSGGITSVRFLYKGQTLVLRSIKTDGLVTTIELQDELSVPAHQGFLNLVQ